MTKAVGETCSRGSIRGPGNPLQALVCTDIDPLTGQTMNLSESAIGHERVQPIVTLPLVQLPSNANVTTKAMLGTVPGARIAWVHDCAAAAREVTRMPAAPVSAAVRDDDAATAYVIGGMPTTAVCCHRLKSNPNPNLPTAEESWPDSRGHMPQISIVER